jgi:RimJ/RimL family protein N-acetyltransferase
VSHERRPAPVVLAGRRVRLEPLGLHHVDALVAAAGEDRATYRLTHVPPGRAAMAAYVAEALEAQDKGMGVPFATLYDGRVSGSTRLGILERWPWPPGHPEAPPAGCVDAVEIGWTWLAASAQRTAANTEAKRLMLGHAFEVWGVRRVTLKTDERNARSRAAIERIGGSLDGLLRAHLPAADGGVRTSAVYSILASEWPAARARLDARLDTAAPAP